MSNPFRYFNSSPEIIRLVVMMTYPIKSRTSAERTQAPEHVEFSKRLPSLIIREHYPSSAPSIDARLVFSAHLIDDGDEIRERFVAHGRVRPTGSKS